MTCKPETVNYEDKKYDKLHEGDSHFFFQGYKLTLYFHFSDQKVETTLILSEKECTNPERLTRCIQYLVARLKSTFYRKFFVEKELYIDVEKILEDVKASSSSYPSEDDSNFK